MKEMSTNQVVDMLLAKETEISGKFHQTIVQILRLGYETERGKREVVDLLSSVEYSLSEIVRILNR